MYKRREPSVLIHGLHHAHRRRVAEEQKARGVADMGAPVILLTLCHAETEGKAVSQRELARMLRLSPATVAVSLRSMERCGYVHREIDRKDARRNLLSLTPRGHEAVELCGQAFQAADRQMLAGFTPEEKELLSGFFVRMLKNLGVTDPETEKPPFPPPPPEEGPHGPGGPEKSAARRQRKKECDTQ